MLNNQNYGITAEDLEKAASVRLFEKAAAAEGINLSELSNSQVEELYSNYQQSSEENTMNDQIIDLFEKQAAYEGIDLDALSDDELAYVYNNFVTNLEEELEDDGEYFEDDGEEEAYEKLAEAEILGRHMARAYMDELEKEAAPVEYSAAGGKMKAISQLRKAGMTKEQAIAEVNRQIRMGKKGKKKADKQRVKARGKRIAQEKKKQERLQAMGTSSRDSLNKKSPSITRSQKRREETGKYLKDKYKSTASYVGKKRTALGELLGGNTRKAARRRGNLALAGLGAAGAAGAYGVSQMGKEASYEAFEIEALDRALDFIEFGKEASYDDSSVDIRAIELLEEEGYDVSPLFDDEYDFYDFE